MNWNIFEFNLKGASALFFIGALCFFFVFAVDGLSPIYGLLGVLDLILAYLTFTWDPTNKFDSGE